MPQAPLTKRLSLTNNILQNATSSFHHSCSRGWTISGSTSSVQRKGSASNMFCSSFQLNPTFGNRSFEQPYYIQICWPVLAVVPTYLIGLDWKNSAPTCLIMKVPHYTCSIGSVHILQWITRVTHGPVPWLHTKPFNNWLFFICLRQNTIKTNSILLANNHVLPRYT